MGEDEALITLETPVYVAVVQSPAAAGASAAKLTCVL